jgi:hypothetical protein
LAAIVWSMYFARKGNWLMSGVIGGFSTLTRVVGIAILPSLFMENIYSKNNFKKAEINRSVLFLFLVPIGLSIYMYYLWVMTGDPLNFLHTVGIFGGQRSSNIVILPQVFYRYLFKIIPNLNINYLPSLFSTLMEFLISILFLTISVISFYKLRISYSLFILLGYLIPTLSGSFSSLPRYVAVLFPSFILIALWLKNKSQFVKFAVYGIFGIGLLISTLMFTRGYWIS